MDSVSLDEPQSAATFIMRGYAMSETGVRAEATLLYRVLQKYRGDDAVLRRQLRKEYGVTFDHMATALRRQEMPTFDEISREQTDAALSRCVTWAVLRRS
jgi:methylphosphotriester-DNA--protein-cysteine methyltransferase